jgi:hypothetical protein
MGELRSCYFCGTTAALAEYETLPADLRANDAASQQVVLCDRCQTKLTNVLTPIVDRLGAAGTIPRTTESTESSPATSPGTDVAAQSDVTFTGTSSSDARDATTDPPTTDATADESPAADERTGAESDDATTERRDTSPAVRAGPHDEDDTARGKQRNEPDAEAGDGHESRDRDGASGHEERDGESGDRADGDEVDGHDGSGETDEADEAGGADEADREADENLSRFATDTTTADATDASATDETDVTDASATDETDATDASATDGAEPERDDLDRVYYKLLRFLRNREFPIPRAEAEAVARSAYDLTEREATQVIQRAVDRDVLAERDGDLHRT